MKEPSTDQCAVARVSIGPNRGHDSDREAEFEVGRLVDMSFKPSRHSVVVEVYDDQGSLLRADLTKESATRLSVLLERAVDAIAADLRSPDPDFGGQK